MSVQSEIDRIITAVGNAYSKVSEKGGTVPASQTVANLATAIGSIPAGSAKETWVIKRNAAGEFATTQISFTSNGQKFTSIGAEYSAGSFIILRYDNNEVAGYDIAGGGVVYEFNDEAYRKLTFDTPPTGALLTWLQSNAVKQPDGTAVQDTKALTITSNGTLSVTPDAPYDGLSSVDVTVDVASGGGALSVETGTLTSTKKMSAPGTYDYTFDLSPITNMNDRSVIILISQGSYIPGYMVGSIDVLAFFVRLNKSDKFCMYKGLGIDTCVSFSVGASYIKLKEASIGNPSLETPAYIAI